MLDGDADKNPAEVVDGGTEKSPASRKRPSTRGRASVKEAREDDVKEEEQEVVDGMLKKNKNKKKLRVIKLTPSHWDCYTELVEKMQCLKDMSVMLESDRQSTISSVLANFVSALYDKERLFVDDNDKEYYRSRWIFCTGVRKKLLEEIDDSEQVFLWATMATLDGRRKPLNWMSPIWSHSSEWPKTTGKWAQLGKLRSELEKEIVRMVSS